MKFQGLKKINQSIYKKIIELNKITWQNKTHIPLPNKGQPPNSKALTNKKKSQIQTLIYQKPQHLDPQPVSTTIKTAIFAYDF